MILKAKFRFNRPIDTSKDFISTKDAFTVTIFGKEYSFDFLNYYGNVKKEDPAILEYEGTDLDTDAFPDSAELVRYAEYIDTLNECSLDTGDNTLYLLEVLEFTLIRNDGSVCLRDDESVCIGAEILEDFNFRHMLKLADELPQEGLSVDGDTILKDQLDELFDEDYTGIYAEIIGIWKEARTDREKSLIKKMFETFTGISLKDYLEKCVITIAEEKHNER